MVYNKSWNQILWCQALDPIMTLCVLVISPSIAIIFYIYVHRYNCVSQDIISGHLVVSKNYPCELSIKCWNFHFWNRSSWKSLKTIGLFSVDFSGSIRIFSQNWYENICVMSGRCGTRDRKTESIPFTRKRVISTYFEREMPLQWNKRRDRGAWYLLLITANQPYHVKPSNLFKLQLQISSRFSCSGQDDLGWGFFYFWLLLKLSLLTFEGLLDYFFQQYFHIFNSRKVWIFFFSFYTSTSSLLITENLVNN